MLALPQKPASTARARGSPASCRYMVERSREHDAPLFFTRIPLRRAVCNLPRQPAGLLSASKGLGLVRRRREPARATCMSAAAEAGPATRRNGRCGEGPAHTKQNSWKVPADHSGLVAGRRMRGSGSHVRRRGRVPPATVVVVREPSARSTERGRAGRIRNREPGPIDRHAGQNSMGWDRERCAFARSYSQPRKDERSARRWEWFSRGRRRARNRHGQCREPHRADAWRIERNGCVTATDAEVRHS